jgi:Bacteriophage HK97-gp10, putative tail-component
MSVKISLSGVAELDRCLKGMPKVLQNNLLQNAHVAAAKPLVVTAKSNAPVGETGNLRRSIGIERISRASSGGIGVVQVGPRRGGGNKGYHGHLIEYGKTNRGELGDRTRPNPFMADAFGMTQREVEKNIAFQVGVKVAQYIVRTVKR